MTRTADVVTAVVLAVFAGLVVFDSLRLGIGWGTDGPRSGFFPFWLGVGLLVACASNSVRALRKNVRAPFVTREQLGPVLKVLVPAVGLVALTHVVGLYVASALYIGVYMRWIGRHSWTATILVAVAIPVATFFVFERWFLVPLPKGPLEAWLGY